MTRTSKFLGTIGLSFLIAAAIMWVMAFREVYGVRQRILEVPTHFDKGTIIDRSFTVDLASTYWIVIDSIEYPANYKFSLSESTPPDPFVVHYEVTSGDKIIANGDNQSTTRPALLRRDDFSRIVAEFAAEANISYKLRIRFEDVAPEIASRRTIVAVILDLHVREGNNYLAKLLKIGAILVAVIGLTFVSPFLYGIIRRSAVQDEGE